MLIEFSVSNFKSFREKQVFSMVAAPRLRKKDCVFRPDVLGEKLPDLLKVAAIYGPNASGKSNLLKAFETLQTITKRKPTAESQILPVAPFRFDEQLSDEPSRFEVHFIQNRQRYQFELALTRSRIVEERLTAYPRGVETLLYERVHDASGQTYQFGVNLEGGTELHNAWKKLTGPQMLFIAQAVANSSEELLQLREPFSWLQDEFTVLEDSDMEDWALAVEAVGCKRPIIGDQISKYLQEVDVPVTKILFEDQSSSDPKSTNDSSIANGVNVAKRIATEGNRKTTLTHTTELGSADFDLSEESKGTRNLIGFFVPWTVLQSHVVLVDELDSSLHPKIVEALVRKHLLIGGPGQLIFTTHDTHLMDTKVLRRDQFWLTERNANGATRLRSIHDFHGRESEDIEKRYYEGQYRALPVLPPERVAAQQVSSTKD